MRRRKISRLFRLQIDAGVYLRKFFITVTNGCGGGKGETNDILIILVRNFKTPFLPVQVTPFPLYPVLHVHVLDPCVFVHVASE